MNARELVAEVRALLERALLANSRITRRRAQHLPQLPQSSLQQTKTWGSAPRLRSGISKSPVLAPQSPSPTLQLPPTTNIGSSPRRTATSISEPQRTHMQHQLQQFFRFPEAHHQRSRAASPCRLLKLRQPPRRPRLRMGFSSRAGVFSIETASAWTTQRALRSRKSSHPQVPVATPASLCRPIPHTSWWRCGVRVAAVVVEPQQIQGEEAVEQEDMHKR